MQIRGRQGPGSAAVGSCQTQAALMLDRVDDGCGQIERRARGAVGFALGPTRFESEAFAVSRFVSQLGALLIEG
ncbi:MAG: hypothetical protein ACK4IT_04405 [Thioalkalivibrionaceae bacterium]